MLLSAAYGSVSDIEILWILVALTGLAVTSFNLRDAYNDFLFLRENGIFNGRRAVAKTTLYTESTRFVIHSIFLTIGVLAGLLPEAPDTLDLPAIQVAIGAAIRWGLIIGGVLLMSQSIALRWMRNQLRKDD